MDETSDSNQKLRPDESQPAERRPGSRKTIQIVLSIFLVYHLLAVVILPNPGSIVGRELATFFLPYANTLSFNTSWQFFSPGPSPMFYLEYFVDFGGERGETEPMPYPPTREAGSWSDAYNRRLYGMRFFALVPERLERFFVPFLCRQHPGALSVSVQSVYEPIQLIERASEYTDFKDMQKRLDFPRQRFDCPVVDSTNLLHDSDQESEEP